MNAETIQFTIASDLDKVHAVSEAIQQASVNHGMSETEAFQIQLATVEAMNNVIVHAYAHEATHKLKVKCMLSASEVQIIIQDTGSALNQEKLAASHPHFDDDPLAESGRGLMIIKSVMDAVNYVSHHGVNKMTLIKRRAIPAI